jgi:hypothetical protein
MKLGVEVEGSNLGARTIFCQAQELERLMSDEVSIEREIDQIYISDHTDVLTHEQIEAVAKRYGNCFITIETLTIQDLPSSHARYMIAIPWPEVSKLVKLGPLDQVKLTHGKNVLTITSDFGKVDSDVSLRTTIPEDFEGDIDL